MKNTKFNSWVHKFGFFSGMLLVVLMMSVPIVCSAVFGIWPQASAILPGITSVALMMLPFCFAESIAYPPLIGPGAVYMAYVTGNTAILKLPVTLSALSIADVEQGTDEANAVSLVAVGVSSIVVILILIIGMLCGSAITPLLNHPVLAPAFNNVTPAVMGTLLGMFLLNKEKYYIVPIIVAVILGKVVKMNMAYYLLIAVAAAVVAGVVMDKLKKNGTDAEA